MSVTVPQTRLRVGRVGERLLRDDAIPKVKGDFAYASDLSAPGMLWGDTLRSPRAHARIVSLDIAAALAQPGVHAVLTHVDVPGLTLAALGNERIRPERTREAEGGFDAAGFGNRLSLSITVAHALSNGIFANP